MRKEKVDFKGIVRVPGGHVAPAGSLEELINMRTETGSLKAIGKKVVVLSNTPFFKIIEHATADFDNLIAIIVSGEHNEHVVAYIDKTNGATIQEICPCSTTDTELSVLNNMLIINDRNESSMAVYQFKDGAYALLFGGFPGMAVATQVTPTVTQSTVSSVRSYEHTPEPTETIQKIIREQLISALKECRSVSDEYTEGYILISTSYTLFDGSETKMSPPFMIRLGSYVSSPFEMAVVTQGTQDLTANILVEKLFLSLTSPDLTGYKDLIKAINIYCSNPVSLFKLEQDGIALVFDVTNLDPDYWFHHMITNGTSIANSIFDYKMFESLLFYRQHSIPIDEPLAESYQIKFGDALTTGKTMLVDSIGWVSTVGKPFIYNNRQHLYDYKKTLIVEPAIFNTMIQTAGDKVFEVRVFLKEGAEDLIIKGELICGAMEMQESVVIYYPLINDFISYPDSRAYKIEFVGYNDTTQLKYKQVFPLEPSLSYNYAYHVRTVAYEHYVDNQVADNDVIEKRTYSETNVLIVSEYANPFYFPVEHSYRIGGNIKDLAIMVEQISEAQTGQYPIVVLTDKGIFALQQGSGIVLYSNLVPISNDRCEGGSIQTKNGVVYLANRSVNILVGRQAQNLSFPLEKLPDLAIRANASYNLACGNVALYNILPYLSEVDFRDYIDDAILLYDSVREEIIVSNKSHNYSYVYSLRTQLWHKLLVSFTCCSNNYALQTTQSAVSAARPATAQVIVSVMVVREAYTFNAASRAVIQGADTIIAAGIELSLYIDNTQQAAYLTQTAMPLYLCVEEMVGAMPTVAINVDLVANVIYFYTSNADKTNTIVAIQNITTVVTAETLLVFSSSVEINSRGLGETVGVTINGIAVTTVLLLTDTYETVATRLADLINAAVVTVTAVAAGNAINITTKATGAAMGNYTISASSSLFSVLSHSHFTGAKDETPIASDVAVDIVDITQEELTGSVLTHVQTRPLKLGSEGYKTISRALLRGEIYPATNPYGIYIYTSNNMLEWSIVCAGQTMQEVASLRLLRARKSSRYYVIVAGGYVDIKHNIAYMDVVVEDKIENKER